MPIHFRQARLSNGLQVIAEDDPAAHTAAVGFFVKTGARDEAPALMGVSHFLEHMMFKGSVARSAEAVDRDFDDIGAHHNAFTTQELTAFHAHVLPEHLAQAAEILADILRPALRADDFDREKGVILEEIAMYADQPFWLLYEHAMERYYGPHPLGHRVLGLNETISAMTQAQMAAYFSDRYAPDNMVVALAGRLEFDRMIEQLDARCGSWGVSRTARRYPPMLHTEGEITLMLPTVSRHYTLMVAPGPSMQDDRRYAAMVLAQVLGDAEGSRLYWSLVETGLAEEAQSQYEARDGAGEFYVLLVSSPEQADLVEAEARRAISTLVDSLTHDDLERVRNKIATGVTVQGERPAGRMRRLGVLWTYQGHYTSLEEELAKINAVTIDDLRRTWEAFPFAPMFVGRLRPQQDGHGAAR